MPSIPRSNSHTARSDTHESADNTLLGRGLVVFLHGTGGSGVTDCFKRAADKPNRDILNMTKYANELGIVIACPTSTRVQKQWNLEAAGA